MRPKILIVDDRSENLLALERILVNINADLVRATSGNQALAETLNKEFALVLMDVQMPDMDGFETVELLRQQEKTRYLPVIFVSAIYGDEVHLIKGVKTGAVDFIIKPIVPQILIGKINIILDLYHQKKELESLAREREKREHIFKLIARALVNGVEDQDIFETIVKTTAEIFKTEHVRVGRIKDNNTVETCVTFMNGQIISSHDYDIMGTPCEIAHRDGLCVFQDNVRKRFPKNPYFTQMNIKGYVGVSVKDTHGNPIGILHAFSENPLQLPEYSGDVLEILAGRAAAVLEQQKAAQIQQLLKQRLKQAQKMEAIGTLAGGIAHDFNNILFPMLGFTEMARDSVKKDDPLYGILERVMKAILRAKELVQQILTFSRQSGLKKKDFKIHTVVIEALKLMRATIPTTIDIQQDIDPDCGMINGDPTQIHQVVMNLCTNAYHAMREDGGILSVSLHKTEALLDIDAAQSLALKPGKYIKLEIRDTGIGIDGPTLEKIFDPYFTTKPHGQGTGLGLSVAHGIIKRNGGTIAVSSEIDKGAVFHIFFPQITQTASNHDQQPQPASQGGKEHILVVDDEKAISDMMRMMLEQLGYTVESDTNPVDALGKIKKEPDLFDLVLTDMTMPEMTGINFTKEILKIRPDIPILLCTGFSELMDPEKAKKEGLADIVMKPISKNKLAAIIRKILDETIDTKPEH